MSPAIKPVVQYAVAMVPSPVMINGPVGLTILVTNIDPVNAIFIKSITFSIPIGNSTDTIALMTTDTFNASCPTAGWSFSGSNGIYTLTPGAATPAGNSGVLLETTGIELQLTGGTVNAAIGTCDIVITEITTDNAAGTNPTTRTPGPTLPITKYPETFSLTNFTITPSIVPPGGAVQLAWDATPAGCTIDLYISGVNAPIDVTTVNAYPPNSQSQPLYLQANTEFTLAANIPVPGAGSVPYQVFAQAIVNTPQIINFVCSTDKVYINNKVTFSWSTQQITICDLVDQEGRHIADGLLPDSKGSYSVTLSNLKRSNTYYVHGRGNDGILTSAGITVSVYYPANATLDFINIPYQQNALLSTLAVSGAPDNLSTHIYCGFSNTILVFSAAESITAQTPFTLPQPTANGYITDMKVSEDGSILILLCAFKGQIAPYSLLTATGSATPSSFAANPFGYNIPCYLIFSKDNSKIIFYGNQNNTTVYFFDSQNYSFCYICNIYSCFAMIASPDFCTFYALIFSPSPAIFQVIAYDQYGNVKSSVNIPGNFSNYQPYDSSYIPCSFAISGDGGTLYLSSDNLPEIAVIDTAKMTVSTITLTQTVTSIVLSTDGTKLYAALGPSTLPKSWHSGGDPIVVIDTSKKEVVDTFIPIPGETCRRLCIGNNSELFATSFRDFYTQKIVRILTDDVFIPPAGLQRPGRSGINQNDK